MYKRAVTAVLITSVIGVEAQSFQTEISAKYVDIDFGVDLSELSPELEDESGDTLGFSATQYFSKVSTRDVPLREAAFLSRSSFIGVGYTQSETETVFVSDIGLSGHIIDEGTLEQETRMFRAGFYIPNTIFYFGLDRSRIDSTDGVRLTISDGKASQVFIGSFEKTTDISRLTFGLTPTPEWLITTEILDISETNFAYNLNVQAKYLKTLNNERSVGIEFEYLNSDDVDTTAFTASYYFNYKTSLDVYLSDTDSNLDAVSSDTKGLGFNYFFTHRFYANLDFHTETTETENTRFIGLVVGTRI